jgi:hypothetical protein
MKYLTNLNFYIMKNKIIYHVEFSQIRDVFLKIILAVKIMKNHMKLAQ